MSPRQASSLPWPSQLDEWSRQSQPAGVVDRLVAANAYSFADAARPAAPCPPDIDLKSSSSMAPSARDPSPLRPDLHAPSTPSCASLLSPPPSLAQSDVSSRPDSSVDTDLGKLVPGYPLLDEGPDGVLEQRSHGGDAHPTAAILSAVYECSFGFLDCSYTSADEAEWRVHVLSHFGGQAPPRTVSCPLCDFSYTDRTGERAWEVRMSHVAAHHRLGFTLATSRPDFGLYSHLWRNRIIDNAQLQELKSGIGSVPYHITQGREMDERQRRRPPHPQRRVFL